MRCEQLISSIRSLRNQTQYDAAGGVSSELALRAIRLAEEALEAVAQLVA